MVAVKYKVAMYTENIRIHRFLYGASVKEFGDKSLYSKVILNK